VNGDWLLAYLNSGAATEYDSGGALVRNLTYTPNGIRQIVEQIDSQMVRGQAVAGPLTTQQAADAAAGVAADAAPPTAEAAAVRAGTWETIQATSGDILGTAGRAVPSVAAAAGTAYVGVQIGTWLNHTFFRFNLPPQATTASYSVESYDFMVPNEFYPGLGNLGHGMRGVPKLYTGWVVNWYGGSGEDYQLVYPGTQTAIEGPCGWGGTVPTVAGFERVEADAGWWWCANGGQGAAGSWASWEEPLIKSTGEAPHPMGAGDIADVVISPPAPTQSHLDSGADTTIADPVSKDAINSIIRNAGGLPNLTPACGADCLPRNPAATYITVPSCDGMTYDPCAQALRDAGFTGTLTRVYASFDDADVTKPAGAVLSMAPTSGHWVASDGTVTITTNPLVDSMPVAVPAIQPDELYVDYAARVSALGLQPVRADVAESNYYFSPDVALSVPPRALPNSQVAVQTNPAGTDNDTTSDRCRRTASQVDPDTTTDPYTVKESFTAINIPDVPLRWGRYMVGVKRGNFRLPKDHREAWLGYGRSRRHDLRTHAPEYPSGAGDGWQRQFDQHVALLLLLQAEGRTVHSQGRRADAHAERQPTYGHHHELCVRRTGAPVSGPAEVEVTEPRAYEESCLDQIRGRLAFIASGAARQGRTLKGARLTGSYPETKIIIEWEERNSECELDIPLWAEEFQGPTGLQLHPEVVAVLATQDLEEP
jgi:hypothetical protein